MTLIIEKPTTSKLILAKTFYGFIADADARDYLTRVHTAEGQTLEPETCLAIEAFVTGCKADGIWTAIKASCILAGARTLTGALVPLVGTAPTNVGGLFVSGDYNRKTGLVGDGSIKYLDSNRNNNADPQNSKHISVFVSFILGSAPHIGAGLADVGSTHISQGEANLLFRSQSSTSDLRSGTNVVGLIGQSRSNSTGYITRSGGTQQTFTRASQTPLNASTFIFKRNGDTVSGAQRLSFYSIGESLNLALLDARVTTLINAFAAAIP
jgi:hypothetical protein